MAFGWSAGDIASALKLLLTVGKALKEACGASSEYAETQSFLRTLQTTLQNVQAFDETFIGPHRAGKLREQCNLLRLPVTAFLDDIKRFEPALATGNKRNKLLTAPRKIQWAIVMPGKIKQLREHIDGLMISIGLLMGSYTL
jgi:hypothetical protein